MYKIQRNHWITFITLACFMITSALSLSSCDGGKSNDQKPQQTVTPAIVQTKAKLLLDTSVPASAAGNDVHIADIRDFLVNDGVNGDQYFNIVYWGKKDTSGKPTAVTQLLVYQNDPTKGVRVFFDGNELPTAMRDETSKNSTFINYAANSAMFTVYDVNGNMISQRMLSKKDTSLIIASTAAVVQKSNLLQAPTLDPADAAFARQLIGTIFGEVGSTLTAMGLGAALIGVSAPVFIIGGAIGLTGYVLLETANIIEASRNESVRNYLVNLPTPDAENFSYRYSWPTGALVNDTNPSPDILPVTPPAPPASIYEAPMITPGNLNLKVVETGQLRASLPSGLDITNVVKWESGNPAVATVGDLGNGVPGKVTAVGPGTATISATNTISNQTAFVLVTVTSSSASSGSGGTYRVSGSVYHFGGWKYTNKMVDITITNSQGEYVTWTGSSNGDYTFYVPNGTYTITPYLGSFYLSDYMQRSPEPIKFDPPSLTISVNGVDLSGVDLKMSVDWRRIDFSGQATTTCASATPHYQNYSFPIQCPADAASYDEIGLCGASVHAEKGTISADGVITINSSWSLYPGLQLTMNLTGRVIGLVQNSQGKYIVKASGTFSESSGTDYCNGGTWSVDAQAAF